MYRQNRPVHDDQTGVPARERGHSAEEAVQGKGSAAEAGHAPQNGPRLQVQVRFQALHLPPAPQTLRARPLHHSAENVQKVSFQLLFILNEFKSLILFFYNIIIKTCFLCFVYTRCFSH